MTSVDSFDYVLPDAAIAETPVEPRDAARLLVSLDPTQPAQHTHVRDLPRWIEPGDVVVINETKVLPARLRLRKPTGGAVEVLLLEPADDGSWSALVRPSRRVPDGSVFELGDLRVEVRGPLEDGRRRVVLHAPGGPDAVGDALLRHGVLPLPPYITAPLADPARYQTVFARVAGSVAAPTAGLHLTTEVLDELRRGGAEVHPVELRVGLDTFRPIATNEVTDHVMHSEQYAVPESTLDACRRAHAGGHRVIAIGTTAVRALESAALGPPRGRTTLFIHDDYPFAMVDVLLTNFHLPRSTLLVLLDAFVGPRWRELYALALERGYRFLSFGDAMLVARRS